MPFPKENFSEKKSENGFTLIELLVSIFIFALVMSMIYGAYKTVLTSAEAVKYGDVPHEQGRCAMERMTEDLEGLYVSHEAEYNLLKKEGKPDPYAVRLGKDAHSGRSFSSLRFVSSAHVSFGSETGAVHSEIIWYVASTPDGRYELKRSDRRFPDGKPERSPRDPVLCRNVSRFEIEASDASGNAQDHWDSEAGTGFGVVPSSLSILLESSNNDGKALFRTLVSIKPQRMRSLAEPDSIGGTAVKSGKTETNEKKESSETKKQ